MDDAGHLHVGPRSAGAVPGPACYAQGGVAATVTDADLVLGRLRPDDFAGGQLTLDVAAAEKAIATTVAEPLGMSLQAAAEGIVALGNAQMVGALELVSVERGFDPRDFSMVAFGGAGPTHAAERARELGCRRVVIPPEAGVQSALGLLVADARRDLSVALLRRADDLDLAEIRERYEELTERGRAELIAAGFAPEELDSRLAIDARYVGQAHELSVELGVPPDFTAAIALRIVEGFHAAHLQAHGHSDPTAEVEWVTLRVSVVAPVHRPSARTLPEVVSTLAERRVATIDMTWAGHPTEAPVYARTSLGVGDRFDGPALVIQDESTIAIPPDVTVTVEGSGDLILQLEPIA